MKSQLPLCLILLVFIGTAFTEDPQPYDLGGTFQVVIAANQDKESCLLRLITKLFPDHIVFQQSVYDPFGDCSLKNVQFISIFNNAVVGELALTAVPGTLVYEGTMDLTLFQQYNGTACVNTFADSGVKIYVCRFKYGEAIGHYMFRYNLTTNEIQTDVVNPWFPVSYSTVVVAQNDTHVWKAGTTQNAYIGGQLFSQCGGWSTSISNKNSNVLVTGAIYNSQQINLGPLFDGYVMYSAIVHPRGAAANVYTTKWTNSTGFSASQTGVCSNLNITYDSISNVNDCKGSGCDVVFIMISNGTIYALQTTGFTYTGALRGL